MAQIFVQGGARMAFDGVAIFAADLAASPGASYAFADQTIRFNQSENNSYPDLIDAAAFAVNKVPGLVLGTIEISGVWQPDRDPDAFINAAFGPRAGGLLTPWLMNLVPYAGGAPVKAAGIYWSKLMLGGRFGVSGGEAMNSFQLTGMVLDPNNALGCPTLPTPAVAGVAGAGISSFDASVFTNGAGLTPAVYDLIRSFAFMLDNKMQVQPSTKQSRMASGCTPGQIGGSLTLSQLKGANVPVPQVAGTFPLQLNLPAGNGVVKSVIDTSVSYDGFGRSLAATDFTTDGYQYTLFGKSAGATTTANFPFVCSKV